MTALDGTSCRPETQNGFPSTLSVLSTAVLRHFHYIHKATPSTSLTASLLQACPSVLLAVKSAVPLLPSHIIVATPKPLYLPPIWTISISFCDADLRVLEDSELSERG
ncbi:hypothetical protein DPMN_135898 [Dreissena polymorpha]|uniref:Uncharacterized protein n=1 Tax=Dreissena polymorpha TaxID=45954 RepID=A0A9D4G2N5_DREPO|nr:hypothetical protein DPMN_135898 [Dreissena polymorpha]